MYGLTPYTSFLNLLDLSLPPVAPELWLIALINGCNSIQLVSSHFVEQANFPMSKVKKRSLYLTVSSNLLYILSLDIDEL
jgi:hypothetical protein